MKLQKIGQSLGVVLPKEVLSRLNVSEGDRVYLAETEDGGFKLSASNPESTAAMKVAGHLSRRYRHALKKLAN